MGLRRIGAGALLCCAVVAGGAASAQDGSVIERLRELAGEWDVVDAQGEPTGLRARYATVAAGAAVVETLLAGTEHETVTTYHLEDGLVTATQVSARGRPVRLVPGAPPTGGGLRFEAEGTTMVPDTLVAIELAPSGDGGRRVEWSFVAGGTRALPRRFELRRRSRIEDLAAEAARLRSDLDALQRDIDRRLKADVEIVEAGRPARRERVLRTFPGATGWDVSGTPLRLLVHRQEQRFASTYASEGDAGMTIAHFPFDAKPGCRVRFDVLGGHAYLAVVEETKAPPRRIGDLREFERKLIGGEYGAVIERIVGGRWNEHPIAASWDLSRFAGKRMRLYLVDVVGDHFGQIAISEVSIHEDVER